MTKDIMAKKTKIMIISSVVILILVIGGVFWWKRKDLPKNPPEKVDKPTPNQPNNNPNKKDLADKIKTDLQARLERVKNGSDDSDDLSPYMIFDNYIACIVKGGLSFAKEKEKVFPSDIGTENYQEITNLIKQIDEEREKWIKQRNREADEKLSADPNLFYNAYELKFSGEVGPWPNWGFTGKKNGQEYTLVIPKNHPIFTNFSIPRGGLLLYYRVNGVESLPLVPSPMDGTGLYKIVKFSDQITIKLIEN